MKSNLIVIPIRANSKRLLNKNIKPFYGIPLLEFTINFALNCTENSEIVVCTDCAISREISLGYGLECIGRPALISHEFATTSSVIKHVLVEKVNANGNNYNSVVTLQVTNPLRPNNLFHESMAVFNNAFVKDSVIGVSLNDRKIGSIDDNYFRPFNYVSGQRSQDMAKSYFENGAIYISKPQTVLNNDLFGDKILPFIHESKFVEEDIDTLEDFDKAEELLRSNLNVFRHLFKNKKI